MNLSRIKQFYYQLMPQLTQEEWQWLETRFTARVIMRGDLLTRVGMVTRQVSFIHEGLLGYYVLAEGREVYTFFCKEGEYIADYTSFLTQQPGQGCIAAMEDTTVIELSYEHVQQGYATIPALQQFGRIMAEYLFMMLDVHSTHRISSTAEQRYQRMMEDHPAILQRVPQYIIASHIGVTPEALSRIRKRMMARV